jgi:hypothetical protein
MLSRRFSTSLAASCSSKHFFAATAAAPYFSAAVCAQQYRFAAAATATATAAPAGGAASKFDAGKKKVDPKALPAPTWKDKIKKELMLILKLNLFLLPVLVLASLWMYPPTSAKEEKRLMALYEKNAGWRT